MAGTYADVPGARMAYDRDGTVVASITSVGVITTLSGANMQTLNNENSDGSTNFPAGGYIAFIFPENRIITHHWIQTNAGSSHIWESSTDTTNGYDGTWSTVNTSVTSAIADPQPGYRSNILATSTNYSNIKAIRMNNTSASGRSCGVVHLYGTIYGATPDKLELWHPTLDQPLSDTPAFFDFGDNPRNATVDKSFRLKNLSASLTATTITVSAQALTDGSSPTHVSELTFNYNGGSFASTASLSSLAPGTISQVFTLRNSPGASSVLGLYAQRIIAAATTWA